MSTRRASYGRTDIGKRRATNEDSFLVDDELGLFVVADGMGGHSSGEVASAEAVEALHAMVAREREVLCSITRYDSRPVGSAPPGSQRAQRILESAVQAATYMVFGLSEANPDRKGMGTTLSAMLLHKEFAYFAQVGDSRVYMVRDGKTVQVTEDHTLIAWQLKKGLITPQEAAMSRQKNVITRAVGSRDYVQVDMSSIALQSGDAFLLCSDGLHAYVDDAEIASVLEMTPDDATSRLIDLANQRGGRDNITAIVIKLE